MKKKETEYSKILNKVINLQNQNNFDEAILILEEIIIKFPNDYLPYALMGHSYYIQDKYEEAIPYFKKVLEIKPKSEGTSSRLFHCLNGIGRGDDALKEMIRFLNSVNTLKKDFYKWILEDLIKDLDNPQLNKYRNTILGFKIKFKLAY